jgi:serine/threonine-protein kinase
MRGEPSTNLVNLLARLRLATAAQVQSMAPRVRRLAGDLGDFESVWVDALAQSRLLTPFQAAEINAGRGDDLLHGSYVLAQPIGQSHFAACYSARHVETQRLVRIDVIRHPQINSATAARALTQLAETLAPLGGPGAAVVEEAGISGESVWAVCSAVEGTSALDWIVENGRFSPPVVLAIARAMLERLADLERLGVVHGDLSARNLWLQASGQLVLPMPGLRGIVRPSEGYGFSDLRPDAYDYLAPERIAAGAPPSTTTDLYACGCLWWHLLTGRPPFSGGNSLAKLKAVHTARATDVRHLAPEVPEVLAQTIEQCMARDPLERPRSASEVAKLLGSPTRSGAYLLAESLRRQSPLWHRSPGTRRRSIVRRARPRPTTVLATATVLLLIALWPVWRRGGTSQATDAAATQTAALAAAKATPTSKAASDPRAAADGGAPGYVDPSVELASATVASETSGPEDLELSADTPLRLGELELRAGQVVRGRPGQRPLVRLAAEGLTVNRENVIFEGIDFVWEAETGRAKRARPATMLVVAAQTVEFRGCSFSANDDDPPAAVTWTGSDENSSATGGEITLRDCVLSGVTAVVDCQAPGDLAIEINNSLCVASGPVVRLHEAPQPNQSVTIALIHATARGDSAVLECRYDRLEGQLGSIAVTADDSALDGNPRGGLLLFTGNQRPDPLLRAIRWSGAGSIVTERTAVAVWRNGGKRQQVLPEDELEIAGLVRSQLEFAGSADGPPSASRVVRWQVPLRSSDPPGADTNGLFLPRL